jgi:hypothetical protein
LLVLVGNLRHWIDIGGIEVSALMMVLVVLAYILHARYLYQHTRTTVTTCCFFRNKCITLVVV